MVNSIIFGISPTYPAGAEFIEKTIISLQHSFEANWAAVLLAALAVASLLLCRRFFKRIPGHIIAIAITTFLAMFVPYFSTVPQVSDIGIIPSTLPIPHMPEWSFALIKNILPAALTIAALAAIESLLSAVVADGMTDTRHKPNRELVGVGAANIASGAFGGLPITGAIARTATNVRAGGRTRVAAILHAILVLAIVFFAAPLMGSVPLGAIAGILMFTAYNMVEWDRVHRIFRTPLSDVAVMLTTFALTVFVDLTVAIEVGLILAALLFMKRMTDLYQIESLEGTSSLNIALRRFKHKEISIYTIRGPLFFGAANRIDQALGEIPGGHKPYKIIRMVHVPVVDATGLAFLEGTAQKHKRLGGAVYFVGVQPAVLRRMRDAGLLEEIGEDKLFSTTHQALQAVLREIALKTGASIDGSDTQYDLTSLEAEERASVQTLDDKDPIEEILDTVGVSKVAALGSQTMRQTTKFGTRTVKQTAKLGKKLTRAKKKRHL